MKLNNYNDIANYGGDLVPIVDDGYKPELSDDVWDLALMDIDARANLNDRGRLAKLAYALSILEPLKWAALDKQKIQHYLEQYVARPPESIAIYTIQAAAILKVLFNQTNRPHIEEICRTLPDFIRWYADAFPQFESFLNLRFFKILRPDLEFQIPSEVMRFIAPHQYTGDKIYHLATLKMLFPDYFARLNLKELGIESPEQVERWCNNQGEVNTLCVGLLDVKIIFSPYCTVDGNGISFVPNQTIIDKDLPTQLSY